MIAFNLVTLEVVVYGYRTIFHLQNQPGGVVFLTLLLMFLSLIDFVEISRKVYSFMHIYKNKVPLRTIDKISDQDSAV